MFFIPSLAFSSFMRLPISISVGLGVRVLIISFPAIGLVVILVSVLGFAVVIVVLSKNTVFKVLGDGFIFSWCGYYSLVMILCIHINKQPY